MNQDLLQSNKYLTNKALCLGFEFQSMVKPTDWSDIAVLKSVEEVGVSGYLLVDGAEFRSRVDAVADWLEVGTKNNTRVETREKDAAYSEVDLHEHLALELDWPSLWIELGHEVGESESLEAVSSSRLPRSPSRACLSSKWQLIFCFPTEWEIVGAAIGPDLEIWLYCRLI